MSGLTPSARARAVVESATLAITARAGAMRAEGKDVVSLSAGEPDFTTPGDVAEAGIQAINEGQTRYTATSGMPALRAAAVGWLKQQFGLAYTEAEVMATAGAKAGLHMALSAIIEPGDPVCLLAPYWVSYPDLVQVAGGQVVTVAPVPEQGFVHAGDQLDEAARRHGARGVILNYPNNPSGAVPTREQMKGLVDAAVANDLWIISDEIYATMIYDGAEHVSPATFEQARDRTLVVIGATKSHSFTGWRLAFLAGPAEIIAAAGRIQSQVIGNPCTISQHAAIAICHGDHQRELDRRMQEFEARRKFVVSCIAEIDGLELAPPSGAFYALVDARALCEARGIDDIGLAQQLLEDEHVATVPGSAFAIPGFIRISYATSMDELEKALPRLRSFAQGPS